MSRITLLSSFQAHDSRAWYSSWSPDGNEILTCGADKSVKIWGRMGDSWVLKETLDGLHSKSIRSCEMSPDGKYIAAASFDSNISVYRKENEEWKLFTMLEGHVNEVKNVCWSRDGKLLASCSRDRNIIVWGYNEEDDEMDCVSVLSGHTQDVKFVRFNPANNNLYSCSYDDTIKVWLYDGEDFSNINTLRAHEGTVWGLAFNSSIPSAGESAGQITNLSTESPAMEEERAWGEDDDGIMDGIEVPDDTRIEAKFVSCGMDGHVVLWKEVEDNIGNSEETHKVILNGGNNDEPFYSIDWNQNGVLVAGGNNALHLLTEVGEDDFIDALEQRVHDCDVNCIRWNPAFPNEFVTCDDLGLVKVWRIS
ncbi:hypothetical protein WA556_007154, partial [Blastocystis sp. ATCC 50177/Nand II]